LNWEKAVADEEWTVLVSLAAPAQGAIML